MRDSFYTGVAEGIIGSERIIKMMRVIDDKLVIEEKGVYSVEVSYCATAHVLAGLPAQNGVGS